MASKAKSKIVKDVTRLVLSRRTWMCNVLEYKDTKVVHQKYASLFFVCGISPADNELITLEIIHRYVEFLDRYCGDYTSWTSRSVQRLSGCLDHHSRNIFNFQKAYAILDELIIAGETHESSKKSVLCVLTIKDINRRLGPLKTSTGNFLNVIG